MLNLYIFHLHQWVAAFSTWAEIRFLNAKGSRRVYTEWSRKNRTNFNTLSSVAASGDERWCGRTGRPPPGTALDPLTETPEPYPRRARAPQLYDYGRATGLEQLKMPSGKLLVFLTSIVVISLLSSYCICY